MKQRQLLKNRYQRIVVCLMGVDVSLAIVTIADLTNRLFEKEYTSAVISLDLCKLIDWGWVRDFGDGTFLLTKLGRKKGHGFGKRTVSLSRKKKPSYEWQASAR